MHPSNPELRAKLLALITRDTEKRQELVDRGELYETYHPEMEAVHRENAQTLDALLDDEGWPLPSHVGEDGVEAAWIVAVHAIGEPEFQRRCRALLEAAVQEGEAPARLHAVLFDRIRFNERRPQRYGTQIDWDAAGEMSPWEIENPDEVDARRREVGLPPLAESVREVREQVRQEGGRAPKPYADRQAEILAWARRVGWLDARA
ncbi:MAG: DUF6624 domain-containing protein [Myxococcota bacterium]